MYKRIFLVVGLAFLAGCAKMRVEPVSGSLGIDHICIEKNHKVKVDDLLDVIQEGFDKHGISTVVYPDDLPDSCEYIMTYTAFRGWDLVPYLTHTEIRLTRNGRKIGYAEFHLQKFNFSLKKWRSTNRRIGPLIDKLLVEY